MLRRLLLGVLLVSVGAGSAWAQLPAPKFTLPVVVPATGGTGSGANTALSNLAAVAINAALVPGTAGALDVGSTTKPWGSLWLAGTSGTPGTNQFKITGASTGGVRTLTLADGNTTLVAGTMAPTLQPVFVTDITAPLIYGSAAANGDVTIRATSSGTTTTSYIILGDAGTAAVGVGTASPTGAFNVHATTLSSVRVTTAAAAYTLALGTDGVTGPHIGYLGGYGFGFGTLGAYPVSIAATGVPTLADNGTLLGSGAYRFASGAFVGLQVGTGITTALPQTFTTTGTVGVYNNYTATNYEGLSVTADGAGNVTFAAATLGTGTDNINIVLTPTGTGRTTLTGGITGGCSGTPTAATLGVSTTCTGPEAAPDVLLLQIRELQAMVAALQAAQEGRR